MTAGDGPVAYEIVYDCADEVRGRALAEHIEEVVSPTWQVDRSETGPIWALTLTFPSERDADRFFHSEFYSRVCVQAREECEGSVLVVPLGPVAERQGEETGGGPALA